jgi:uncharacterized membrane protein
VTTRPLITAGTVLGIGMGGFLDGIIAHQLLQVHNMLSNRLPPNTVVNLEINMFWDGLFHALTWTATAVGIWMLWKAVTRGDVQLSGRVLFGASLFGWGLFNFVEGVVDHYVLQVHHVVQRLGQSAWDLAFLASGILLMLLGRVLMRRSTPGASVASNR